MAGCDGAMFQVGAAFGTAFTAPNIRAISSGGRTDAYRPHMVR